MVSVTCCLGKRFKHIMSQRLVAVLESLKFDMDRFAYIRKRSATQALLILIEKVKKALIKGEKAGVIFFDFTDAFGSVNRAKLLEKVGRDFGISGRLFMHIHSFLSNRYARLKICGVWLDSEVGTSAGTRLGPLLFIMYLCDVPDWISPKFADNLAAVVVGKDIEFVEKEMQEKVNKLMEWTSKADMMINSSKTKVMLF